MTLLSEVIDRLAAEFSGDEINWKPQVTKNSKKEMIMRDGVRVAGCIPHIDARAVMNRLDDVVGPDNWSDSYIVVNGDKNVECRLTVLGVTKCDIGEISGGGFADPMKGAYSDALKRAAVKFGVGRYLYDAEMEWLPYDGYRILRKPEPKQEMPSEQLENLYKAAKKLLDSGKKPFNVFTELRENFPLVELGMINDVAKGLVDE